MWLLRCRTTAVRKCDLQRSKPNRPVTEPGSHIRGVAQKSESLQVSKLICFSSNNRLTAMPTDFALSTITLTMRSNLNRQYGGHHGTI